MNSKVFFVAIVLMAIASMTLAVSQEKLPIEGVVFENLKNQTNFDSKIFLKIYSKLYIV